MLKLLFFAATFIVAYTYLLFPLIVYARGRMFRRRFRQSNITPTVSMLIACHNEEASIETKLRNVFSLDYPADKLQIIVASDGSDDRTETIVDQFSDRVTLLRCPRAGKAAALNLAALEATGDVLVFTDANSMFRQDAIRQLVRPLRDKAVGGVAGDQRYDRPNNASSVQRGECHYWSFDRWLKVFQSRAGSVTSATGAIYAIRRELFDPIPDGVTDDFVTSTRVVAAGYRLVFAREAVAYEPVSKDGGAEFQRKVRLMTRGLRGVVEMRRLLNPLRYGFYSLQLFSHKVLRRLVVFPLLLLCVVTPLLWTEGLFFQVATVLQLLFGGSAAVTYFSPIARLRRIKLLSLPAFFVLANTAALIATWNVLRGRRITLWQPQRA